MQIALTGKLAKAMGVELEPVNDEGNPLFTWTANLTTVWDNRRAEDLLVLVNHATRFTVAVYQVKRKDLKGMPEMIKRAIANTLLYMNINPEIVEEYMSLCGDVTFTRNSNRKAAAWVTRAGLDTAVYIGHEYNGIEKMFRDTVGASNNYLLVNYSGNSGGGFYPYEKMVSALTELTGKQAYKYRAFELMVTLDLDVYQAERRIIVPADLEFTRLHEVLQSVFGWRNYHLYDFTVFDQKKQRTTVLTEPLDEYWPGDEEIVLIEGRVLADFMPEYGTMVYTYDMGDNWQHEINLLRVIEDYDQESPYLLEASGQTPPEDVGGVGGFVEFREIMLNPDHPEYETMKEWARFWSPELGDWAMRPRAIRV